MTSNRLSSLETALSSSQSVHPVIPAIFIRQTARRIRHTKRCLDGSAGALWRKRESRHKFNLMPGSPIKNFGDDNNAPQERGSILITALWAVSVFSIMTASLAFHSGEEILLMKRELNNFRHRVDFVSGLNQVVEMIQEDPEPHEDSKEKAWYGDIKLEEPLKARLSIRLEDEESKINLNYASAAFLSAFFKRFEDEIGPLKGSKKDYVKAIEKLKYEKRIESLEELLLVEDFKKEDLEVLRPYFTVYPELPLINPNTASPLVLKALIESLSGDHGTKQIFIGRIEETCAIHGCFFLNQEFNPQIFMEKLKLPKTPLMTQVVQDFLAAVTTDSQTFHLTMTTSDHAQASAIFTCRVGQARPEVFWWHEN